MIFIETNPLIIPDGACAGCGNIGLLPIVCLWSPHEIYVCGADCWNKHFAKIFGPIEHETETANKPKP